MFLFGNEFVCYWLLGILVNMSSLIDCDLFFFDAFCSWVNKLSGLTLLPGDNKMWREALSGTRLFYFLNSENLRYTVKQSYCKIPAPTTTNSLCFNTLALCDQCTFISSVNYLLCMSWSAPWVTLPMIFLFCFYRCPYSCVCSCFTSWPSVFPVLTPVSLCTFLPSCVSVLLKSPKSLTPKLHQTSTVKTS